MSDPTGASAPSTGGGRLQDAAVRGALWTMVHTVVALPIAFMVNLLLARALAPAGYGRLAFLTTLIALAGSVLALGLTSAMIQFGAKAHARGDIDGVRRILSSSQGFRLLVVAPVLTVLVLLLVDVPLLFLALAVVFGVWLPAALDGAPIALFIENKTAAGARIAMASNLIVQAGVVITVLWLGTADAVWASRVVLTAAGIAVALIAVSPSYRAAVLHPTLPNRFPPGFWRFAVPTGAASLIGQLALSRTEVLYLTWLATPEAVGLYALAFGVAGHVFAPAQSLTGPLLPAVASLREVDPDKVADAFARALRVTSTVVAMMTAAALPALATLIPLLYGHEFTAASPAVLALGLIGGVTVLTGPVSTFVLARLSGRTMLRANVAALAINLVVALGTIPFIGLWGAVAANVSAALTQFLVLARSEIKDLHMPARELLLNTSPMVTGGCAALAGWALAVSGLGLTGVAGATVAAATALVLLGVALRLTRAGLEAADAQAIARVVPTRLSGGVAFILRLVTRA